MNAWRLVLLMVFDAAIAAAVSGIVFWLVFVRDARASRERMEMVALARYSDKIGAGGGTS